jgi:hypothetical protein
VIKAILEIEGQKAQLQPYRGQKATKAILETQGHKEFRV